MINNIRDYQALAKKIVRESLRVQQGENFWIACGDPYYYPFAEEVAMASVEVGAYPFITVTSDRISRKKYDNSIIYLSRPSLLSPKLIEVADVQLNLAFPRDPDYLKGVPSEKLGISALAAKPSTEALYLRNQTRANLRTSSLLIPTPEAAEKFGMSFEDYADLIWNSIDIDYLNMSEHSQKIAALLQGGKKVRITSAEGSDLTFSLKGRRIFVDDGIMDDRDIEENVYLQNLPAGEVCCAPVEMSANGAAVFQYNVFMGEPLTNFRTTFKKGLLANFTADEGGDYFKSVMDQCSGDKYFIAELGIGMNPGVTKVIGDLALDEKIIGTIHIAIGENRMMGGMNEATIHWDFVMQKPTLEVDGKVIIENGEYLV